MADNNGESRNLPLLFMRCVYEDDVIGAAGLVSSLDEQDKKAIVSTVVDGHVPLCVAATHGNTEMIRYLVENCRANVEGGDSCEGTPLWRAANEGRLLVVKVLHELGADINATSKSELTSVNNACCCTKLVAVKYLVKLGVDIHKPDENGKNCLMNSLHNSELCLVLINAGASFYEKDCSGNTVLHIAIDKGHLNTMKVLLDYGFDANKTNNSGDDGIRFASLQGRELMVAELLARQRNTPPLRLYECKLLLCIRRFFEDYTELALQFWRESFEIQLENPGVELGGTDQLPDCIEAVTVKVKSLEQFKELLYQDEERLQLFFLQTLLRIIGRHHHETINAIARVSRYLYKNKTYRCSFDLLKFALCLKHEMKHTRFEQYAQILETLYKLITKRHLVTNFQDIMEILNAVSFETRYVKNNNRYNLSTFMEQILFFVHFAMKFDTQPNQLDTVERVVERMVGSHMTDENGQTFLHKSIIKNYLRVVEMLLKFGAQVNTTDFENNTALHFCTQRNTGSDLPNEREGIIQLILKNSPHVDIYNKSGNLAAKGLQLNKSEFINLQCLSATAIRNHQISYVGYLTPNLELFVSLHGR